MSYRRVAVLRSVSRFQLAILVILIAVLLAHPVLSANTVPAFSHIFIIVMENREIDDVVNSHDAPYLTSLAARYALATRYYGVTHPSLPNYLALIGGDTFGIASDCTGCSVQAPNLADQLEEHHRTWKAYMEELPRACFPGASAGGYVKKHNPFMYFADIAGNPDRCARVVPLSELQNDLAHDTVPDFVWITPDLCHSMHDCITWEGDRWLAAFVPQIRASRAWANRGVLFIVWDEGKTSAGCCRQLGGGRVALLAISPLSQAGRQVPTPSNHYALLRTIQETWSLGYLRHSGDAETPVLADLFQH